MTFIIKIILLFFFIQASGHARNSPLEHSVSARHGILDLSSVNEINDEILIGGEWEFYREQLLTPDVFLKGIDTGPEYIKVPGSWASIAPAGPYGYATYRLTVLLPESVRGNYLSVRFKQINSSFIIFLNGKKVTWGRVAETPDEYIPDVRPVTETLRIDSDRLEIICQCSNFFSRSGGIVDHVSIASEDKMKSVERRSLARDLFMFGSLLIIGFYLLSLYALRRKDRSPLYFGLFCVLFSIRSSWDTFFFYIEFFHGMSWQSYARFEYLVDYSGPVLIVLFLYSLYPEEFSKLLVVAAPRSVYMHTIIPFQASVVISAVYGIVSLIRAVKNKRDGALLILLGSGGLMATSIMEILYLNGVLFLANTLSVGIYVFILMLSFVISLRFSKAFATVERLGDELRQKNIDLSRLDVLKDEFLATTSHELRTPINGIIGLAETLMEGSGGHVSEEQEYNLSLIASSGRRLASLINDILDLSRLRHGDIALQLNPLDLHSVVNIVIEQCRPLTRAKSLVIYNLIRPDTPVVLADEARVQQILFNLIGNSIKFTQKGSVTVSASTESDMAVVTVSDTGEGISTEYHDKIFESFTQGDSSISRRHGGSGLGLAITRKLVELHGGSIRVDSAVTNGASFTFTLPVYSSSANPDGRIQTHRVEVDPVEFTEDIIDLPYAAAADSDAPSILIVDDDPVNLRVLMNLMGLYGYNSVCAVGGREALELIRKNSFNCVLLDIMMPEITGYDVLEEIRHDYPLFELPVIMLTAANQPHDIATAFSSGANDFLNKPIQREELLCRLATHISLSRMVRENSQFEILNHELSLARDILDTIIPELPADTSRLKIRSLYRPSRTLGGDFFDFHSVDDRGIGFIVADITGHGISAAMFASMLKIAFHRERSAASDPEAVLYGINRNISGVVKGLYLTAAYVYIDFISRTLTLASAGHPHPLLLKNDGSLNEIVSKGYLIGWQSQAEYKSITVDFNPGDRLILYTDGITEAMNPQGKLYGSRFFDDIKSISGTLDEALEAYYDNVKIWTESQESIEDDITILAVELIK
jgi:two-component system sensor histidine kinase ChiS